MDWKKALASFGKELVRGNFAGVLFWLLVFALGLLYWIGQAIASAWSGSLQNLIRSSKIRRFSDLWIWFLLGFLATLIVVYICVLSIPFFASEGSEFCFWCSAIYTTLIWIRIIRDVNTFWKEAPPFIPIEQGSGINLSSGDEQESLSNFWQQHRREGMASRTEVVESEVDNCVEEYLFDIFST